MASRAANGSSMSRIERALREGAGERDALAHAAGELVRALVVRALEVDQVQEFLRPALRCTARHPAEPQRELDVRPAVSHGMSAASWNIRVGDRRRLDRTRGLGVEARDEVEQRRLAAARCPDEGDELTRAHVQADVVEHDRAVAVNCLTTCSMRTANSSVGVTPERLDVRHW